MAVYDIKPTYRRRPGWAELAAASGLMKAGHDDRGLRTGARAWRGRRRHPNECQRHKRGRFIDLGLREEISRVAVNPGAYVFSAFDTGEEISRFNLAADHEKLHGAPAEMHRAGFRQSLPRRALIR